ncbi:methylmalonate-semialdehyde dehydrogenase (acylating) [Citrus sinensis]|uniref:Methylmalonate-semialdehyde dehydrogenase (Acylating) n=1 Tax=Citrus sinensis TaxID=2711 RepID=A0ACB8J507_CITSI|nr:methylmalonate-semialdehyde dehydrogenase (acylating) [Citrus sinensis]
MEQKKMIPPPPGTFQDREDLIKHVRDFGANQGYVVTIKKSRKDRRVILGCDRGGVYRNRRKIDENKRKRKACSRLINCPFEAIGKKEDDVWVLTIKNGEHNHEPFKDMSEHPYSRRFSEEEVKQIKLMTEAGIKPRQVLKALKQSNPELQSTPRHLYNLKAKIRQGNLSEKSFKSWRPNRSTPVNTSASPSGVSPNIDNNRVSNFIGGKFVDLRGSATIDVINPATQEVVSQVPLTTYEEFKDAVDAAKLAFPAWKNTPVATRQRIMFKLQELIRRDIDKLAMNITVERGTTLKAAQRDVLFGLEVVEQACAVATLQIGEFVPNALCGLDTYCFREPLGVCAGICPFNFPDMTPLWMFSIAVTCGNTFILKPSEKNPGTSMILAALAMEAGLPDGVLNIVHGTNMLLRSHGFVNLRFTSNLWCVIREEDVINHICDDEDIKAISFVASSTASVQMYARAAARGKRVQSNRGGKNYAIIMPDASIDATLNALVSAGFGAAGERCTALSTAVFVGSSVQWEDELVELAKALKVNVGTDASADVGPVVSVEVKDQISRLIQNAVDNGASLLLDGRNIVVPGYENGNFVGPTILRDVTSNMECYKEEIFGPVLLNMQADSLEEAIKMVNRNRFVNGASIFTSSGLAARKFQNEIEARLVGINVPVPSSFSSINESGEFNFCGKSGVQFYTQIKTVAQQWNDLPKLGMPLTMPLSSETDMRSQGVSSVFPQSSERESPSPRVSPAMSSASERDSPSHEVLLSIPFTSERELSDPGVSSLSPTANVDLPVQGVSLITSPTIMDLSNRETSLAMPSATVGDLSSQVLSLPMPQTSERLYMLQTSNWKSPPITSRRTDAIHPPSERIYMPCTSQRNDNTARTSQRTDTAMSLPCDNAYVSMSCKTDSIGQLSHRNDGMAQASHQADATLNQTSDRTYMFSTSLLNDTMSQTFHRTNTTLFPTSEKIYIPCASPGKDHIGSPALRTGIHLHSNIASASQPADVLPPTSERMYMSPLVQRNTGMPPTSERLYMPATSSSQRIYTQNPMLQLDDFSSQGSSITLPTSQRI